MGRLLGVVSRGEDVAVCVNSQMTVRCGGPRAYAREAFANAVGFAIQLFLAPSPMTQKPLPKGSLQKPAGMGPWFLNSISTLPP